MKSRFLFLVFLLFLSFFVLAEDEEDNEISQLLELLKEEEIEINIPDDVSSSYDSESGILTIGNKKINIEKLKEYQNIEKGSLGKYEFEGKNYNKPTHKISSIEINENAVIYNYDDGSSINIPEDVSFDPMTRQFKIGESHDYEWMGKGKVEIKEGSVTLSFIENEQDKTDITNFPIIKTPSGQEISPFQNLVSDEFKLTQKIEKPKQGFVLFNQGGKLYSIDSNGLIRTIENSEFKIEEGKVSQAQKTYINDEKGRIFTVDKLSFSKKEGDYIIFEENDLFINTEKNHNSFYFEIKQDLKTLDINGQGVIKNGDKLLYFKQGKMDIKTFSGNLQKNQGNFLHKVEEIVLYKEDGSSYKAFKIIPEKDGKLNIFEFNSDKPIDQKPGNIQPSGGSEGITQAHNFLNEFRTSNNLKKLEHNQKMKEAADKVGRINLQRGGPGHPLRHGYAEISHYVPCSPSQSDAEILKFAIYGKGGYIGFMGSSGHKRLLISNRFSHAGVSVVRNAAGNRAAVTVTFA